MKKLVFALALIFFIPIMAFSQDPIANLGDKYLNLGLGLGSTVYTGSGYSVTLPPLSVSYEQIILDEVIDKGSIGVGGYFGIAAFRYKFPAADWGWKYSNYVLGARGSFHYPLIDNLDTYTGLILGYEIVKAKEIGTIQTGYSAALSGMVWSWYLGGRYFFSEKFAGMVELGYGITYLNLGVAIKL